MAVSTITSSYWEKNPPKAPHIGNTTVGPIKMQWLAAGTVGDILWIAKIPHGARVVELREQHSNGETAAALSFGFNKGVAAGGGGNASCLISSGAVATMNRMSFAAFPAGWTGQISLSDTDPVRYTTLIAKAESGTFTISCSLMVSFDYTMDAAG